MSKFGAGSPVGGRRLPSSLHDTLPFDRRDVSTAIAVARGFGGRAALKETWAAKAIRKTMRRYGA